MLFGKAYPSHEEIGFSMSDKSLWIYWEMFNLPKYPMYNTIVTHPGTLVRI